MIAMKSIVRGVVLMIAVAAVVCAGVMPFAKTHAEEQAPKNAPKNVVKNAAKKTIVLVAGRPSHGYGAHEHNAGMRLLAKALEASKLPVEVKIYFNGWPKESDAFDDADTIILYMDGGGGHPVNKNLEQIDALMKKGVGIMAMHYGVEVPAGESGEYFRKWIGGYYETHWSINPHWTANAKLLGKHAITRGVKPFAVHDEWYYNMRFRDDRDSVANILEAVPDDVARSGSTSSPRGPKKHIIEASGRIETLMWAVEREDGGRGVGFTGGHFHWNWGNPDYTRLVLNAIVWTAGVPVPQDGVSFTPPTLEELEAGQDEKDGKLNAAQREKWRKQIEAWQGTKP